MRLVIITRTHILLAALLVLALLASLAYLVLSNPALPVAELTSPSGEMLPIYSVQTEQRVVALTFDATWGAQYTETVLSLLKDREVKATFFLTNIWMDDYPEKTQAIYEGGHEIGLHSASHKDMTELGRDEMQRQLQQNQQRLSSVCPEAQPRLFRPPFGAYNDTVLKVAEDQMNLITVQWSIDSLDWKEEVSADYIVNRVTTLLHPGAIILFHNNAPHTPEALPRILDHLQDEDYRTVTVSELLHPPPYEIDHRGRQIPLESE